MAITPVNNQILLYEEYIQDGWKEGMKSSWSSYELNDWNEAYNGLVGGSFTNTVPSKYYNNTACILREDQSYNGKRYPQCGFKFIYTIRNNKLLWAVIFIDFGIVGVNIKHCLNNQYNIYAQFNGTTLINVNGTFSNNNGGPGTIVSMGWGTPGNCQVVFCGETSDLPTQDYDTTNIISVTKFGYYNRYWTDVTLRPAMSCGFNWSGMQQPSSWDLQRAVSNGSDIFGRIVPENLTVSSPVSYLEQFNATTDGNYIKLGTNGTWQDSSGLLQATTVTTPQRIYYSYWGNFAPDICKYKEIAVQNAPIGVVMNQSYDTGENILSLQFFAHTNVGQNGYFFGLNFSDGTKNFSGINLFAGTNFIDQNQLIKVKLDSGTLQYKLQDSSNWSTAIAGFTGQKLTITCYGSSSYSVFTAGSEFTYTFSATNNILSIIDDCGQGQGRNYYEETIDGDTYYRSTQICFTVNLQDNLGNDDILRITHNNENYDYPHNGKTYKVKIANAVPNKDFVIKVVRSGSSVLAEQTYSIQWNKIVPTDQIQTPLDNQDKNGTLIVQESIREICDFTTHIVCENYSKLVSMSDLLMALGQLNIDSNKDMVVVYEDYVNVLTKLKAVYDEIVSEYQIYYVSDSDDPRSPLQRDDAVIVIPEATVSKIYSGDIHLVTGSTNNYYVENQTVSGSSNPYTWVVDVDNPYANKLIVAETIDDSMVGDPNFELDVTNNLQNQIIYIVRQLF